MCTVGGMLCGGKTPSYRPTYYSLNAIQAPETLGAPKR